MVNGTRTVYISCSRHHVYLTLRLDYNSGTKKGNWTKEVVEGIQLLSKPKRRKKETQGNDGNGKKQLNKKTICIV